MMACLKNCHEYFENLFKFKHFFSLLHPIGNKLRKAQALFHTERVRIPEAPIFYVWNPPLAYTSGISMMTVTVTQ